MLYRVLQAGLVHVYILKAWGDNQLERFGRMGISGTYTLSLHVYLKTPPKKDDP